MTTANTFETTNFEWAEQAAEAIMRVLETGDGPRWLRTATTTHGVNPKAETSADLFLYRVILFPEVGGFDHYATVSEVVDAMTGRDA